jgi:hypothetical protein
MLLARGLWTLSFTTVLPSSIRDPELVAWIWFLLLPSLNGEKHIRMNNFCIFIYVELYSIGLS